jgi:sporulation protein YlmC with PRC-barrel domain
MKKLPTIIAMSALAFTFAAPVLAQTASSMSGVVMADHSMRTSKLIGAQVYNDQGQPIGSIIDILVKEQAAEPTAILSVGDYIGGGSKLVAVPLSHVNLSGGKMMMKGATKQMLASMPVYNFSSLQGGGG